MVYMDPIQQSAPSWLVSSVGSALHRYLRGHEFKSRSGLNFFRSYFNYYFVSVYSCEDLLYWFLHRSAHIFHISTTIRHVPLKIITIKNE